jgi:hypothetical protein
MSLVVTFVVEASIPCCYLFRGHGGLPTRPLVGAVGVFSVGLALNLFLGFAAWLRGEHGGGRIASMGIMLSVATVLICELVAWVVTR